MTCEVRKVEINGEPVTMIICSRGQHFKEKCSVCGAPAPFLCDGECHDHVSGTCDRPICGRHTYKPNALEDKDLCPNCRRAVCQQCEFKEDCIKRFGSPTSQCKDKFRTEAKSGN